MKIIGVAERGFVLVASEDEVANLLGHYYSGTREMPKLKIGDDVVVSKMYTQLRELARAPEKLADAKKNLETVVAALELVDPFLPKVTTP